MKHIKKFEKFNEGFDDPWRQRMSGGKDYSEEEYAGEVDAKSFLNRREFDSTMIGHDDDTDYDDIEMDDEVQIEMPDDLYTDEEDEDEDYEEEYMEDEDDEDDEDDNWWRN
jgi:hypothetical protein